MKRLLLRLACTLATNVSFAQVQKTVQLDSINVKGMVYTPDGKPAPAIILTATGPNYNINDSAHGIVLYARTDSTGRFELKGLKFNDTITVENFKYYTKYSVSGSRFIIINLPAPRQAESMVSMVTAKRRKPRPTHEFKLNESFPYGNVSVFPFFRGGKEAFVSYIQSKLTYPEKAIKNNIEGTVEVAFDINRDGSTQNFRIIRGIGYRCDEEVIKAVANSPLWTPGRAFGRPESLTQTVAIQFKLTDK
jgi:TonB family protein